VQLGEMIANVFAALLLMCVLLVVVFVAGHPLWPADNKGKMVILLPPDAITTGSITAPTHLHLPDAIDGDLVQPRPRREQVVEADRAD
jgi:hypothetical protein